MHTVFGWIMYYGYVALSGLLMLGIVGLPVPDETLLTIAGYSSFATNGHPCPPWQRLSVEASVG